MVAPFALFFLSIQSAAAPRPPAEIVVTGPSLGKYKEALDACIARHCPPKDEIALSLEYAEAQMIAGDYRGSRQTLLHARHRNARYAADLPVDVSDLHRAVSRLYDLHGMRDVAQIDLFDVVDALKAGLPPGDMRILAARLEVGEMYAKTGRFDEALRLYRKVAKEARKNGAPLVEGMALFREAALLAAMASVDRSYAGQAQQAAAAILARRDPDWAVLRNGMRFVPVVLAPAQNRAALLNAALATLEPVKSLEPQLLWAPPMDLSAADFGVASGRAEPEWVDVAFNITPAGRVADVEVVRRSAHLPDRWLNVALRSLNARRYAPLAISADGPGMRRVERYAFVSDLAAETRSRIAGSSASRHVDVLDLTPAIR